MEAATVVEERAAGQAAPLEVDTAPSAAGTIALLLGLFLTWITLPESGTASGLAAYASRGVLLSIAANLAFEFRNGVYGLLRTHILALLSLYALTLAEFLVEQAAFDTLVQPEWVRGGIVACLVGYAGLGIGRHMIQGAPQRMRSLLQTPTPNHLVIRLFWLAAGIGYLNMLLAVDFNLWELLYYWGVPRFTQPWGRGRLGDWKALLYELSMLLYLIPPLAGVILARARSFSRVQVAGVAFVLVITLFYAFSGGTRNLFGAYVITLLAAYLLSQPPDRQRGRLSDNLINYGIIAGAAVVLFAGSKLMLGFRKMGFWTYYYGGGEIAPYLDSDFFVDYNLWVISILTDTFPARHGFLGIEVPFVALVRPIPRALWSGKPEGLSIPIEEVLGVEGLTLASSMVGESYIAAGLLGVLLAGVFFGAFSRWWDSCSSPHNSALGVLIYAAGLFAVAISMRSLFAFTTALLPTLLALAYCYWVVKKYAPVAIVAAKTLYTPAQ